MPLKAAVPSKPRSDLSIFLWDSDRSPFPILPRGQVRTATATSSAADFPPDGRDGAAPPEILSPLFVGLLVDQERGGSSSSGPSGNSRDQRRRCRRDGCGCREGPRFQPCFSRRRAASARSSVRRAIRTGPSPWDKSSRACRTRTALPFRRPRVFRQIFNVAQVEVAEVLAVPQSGWLPPSTAWIPHFGRFASNTGRARDDKMIKAYNRVHLPEECAPKAAPLLSCRMMQPACRGPFRRWNRFQRDVWRRCAFGIKILGLCAIFLPLWKKRRILIFPIF